jgi:hypothetical protein
MKHHGKKEKSKEKGKEKGGKSKEAKMFGKKK